MRRGPTAAPGDQRAALMLCLRHVGGYWIGCTSAEPSAAHDQQVRNELFGCRRRRLGVMHSLLCGAPCWKKTSVARFLDDECKLRRTDFCQDECDNGEF